MLLACVLLLLVAPRPAAAATETTRSRLSGATLLAFAYHVDGCVTSVANVYAFQSGRELNAGYDSTVYNCDGGSTFTRGTGPAATLKLWGQAKRGVLVATFPVLTSTYDADGALVSETSSRLAVDLTFTGADGVARSTQSVTYSEPGTFRLNYRATGLYRSASVAGTPDVGWTEASLQQAKSGYLEVTHY